MFSFLYGGLPRTAQLYYTIKPDRIQSILRLKCTNFIQRAARKLGFWTIYLREKKKREKENRYLGRITLFHYYLRS